MSEQTNESSRQQPLVGRLGASIGATVTGGLLLLFISTYFAAPGAADEQLRSELITVKSEVRELRTLLDAHRTAADTTIARLAIKVESGTDDRFTESDAKREFEGRDKLSGERWEYTKREIDRIERRLDGAVELLNK